MYGTFRQDLNRWAVIWFGQHSTIGFFKLARLFWTHPGIQATALFRMSTLCARMRVPFLPNVLHQFTVMLYGLDIVAGLPIGSGLYIPHPVGTAVMAKRIGRNVTLVSGVTIGMRGDGGFPSIGNDVYIGAGARVLGAITVGDGAQIGANAVVLADVPPGATAVGVPARVITPRQGQG